MYPKCRTFMLNSNQLFFRHIFTWVCTQHVPSPHYLPVHGPSLSTLYSDLFVHSRPTVPKHTVRFFESKRKY